MNTQTNSSETECPLIQTEETYLANSNFNSCDELLKSVREFYYGKGYGLSILNSKQNDFVTLKCDRGGKYRDLRCIEGKRKKNTSSRLINCPFRLTGKKGKDGLWFFKPKNLTHSHDPSTDISGHPSFRKLEPDNIQIVKDMTLSGIPPRQILSSLRQQNPNIPATSRTIYNVKKKIRKDTLGGMSEISALFEEFEKGGFLHDVKHDSQGHITHLFMAHPLSVKLAKSFSNTFVMDCTYKTNRLNMPLLDIIGVSCFNTSFYSGFSFLKTETVESYQWALEAFKVIFGVHADHSFVIMSDRELALMNAIDNVFPSARNLLCVWHIEKNVVSNCKGFFEHAEDFDIFMSNWNNIVYSTTEDMFVKNWHEFEVLYREKKDAIAYVNKNWFPYKEKFVSAWTEKYLHFGNRSSSRAEGAHAKLKLYLQVSTGGFKEVCDKICLVVKHEFNEIKVQLANEKIKVLHSCNTPVHRKLMYHVSQFALKKICKQYERITTGTMAPCTGHFTTTMGLPCAHKIINSHENELSLDLIHPQWRIDILTLNPKDVSNDDGSNRFVKLLDELNEKYQTWPLHKKETATLMITNLINQSDTLFEPLIQRPRGRPPKAKKKKGTTSTTRKPSRFEYVESQQKHNPSSSASVVQRSNEVTNEVSNIHHKNNMIDLNLNPDFSSEWMSFE